MENECQFWISVKIEFARKLKKKRNTCFMWCTRISNVWNIIATISELPHHRPAIVGTRPKYRVRDSVRANCTSRLSKPAANLTWSINNLPVSKFTHFISLFMQKYTNFLNGSTDKFHGFQVNPSYVKYHKPIKHFDNNLETAVTGIQFVINKHHFIDGKLKVFKIYFSLP